MNRILMCLDYNGTIDNLIEKCANYESGGSFPTFFRGISSMSVATKSVISIAIITAAKVDDIKEEIRIINHYASKYCKLSIPEGESLVNYIVGGKNQELYNYNTGLTQEIPPMPATKKDGVETVLSLPSEKDAKLLITGGDSFEDIPMINAETGGIPNVFIAPKVNKMVTAYEGDTTIIRDAKNNNSEGIGRGLISLSKSLEEFNLKGAFTPKQISEQEESESEFDAQAQEEKPEIQEMPPELQELPLDTTLSEQNDTTTFYNDATEQSFL